MLRASVHLSPQTNVFFITYTVFAFFLIIIIFIIIIIIIAVLTRMEAMTQHSFLSVHRVGCYSEVQRACSKSISSHPLPVLPAHAL